MKRKSLSSCSPSKKLKVDHHVTLNHDDQEVPTSQSDEKELLAPLRPNEEPEHFRRKVVDWQKSTQSDTSISPSPPRSPMLHDQEQDSVRYLNYHCFIDDSPSSRIYTMIII